MTKRFAAYILPFTISLHPCMFDDYGYAEIVGAGSISCADCGSRATLPRNLLQFYVPSALEYAWVHTCGKRTKIMYDDSVDIDKFIICVINKNPVRNRIKYERQLNDGKLYNIFGHHVTYEIDFPCGKNALRYV